MPDVIRSIYKFVTVICFVIGCGATTSPQRVKIQTALPPICCRFVVDFVVRLVHQICDRSDQWSLALTVADCVGLLHYRVERCRKELRLCSRWSEQNRLSTAATSSLDGLQQQLRALLRDFDKRLPDVRKNLVSSICLIILRSIILPIMNRYSHFLQRLYVSRQRGTPSVHTTLHRIYWLFVEVILLKWSVRPPLRALSTVLTSF